ncbi:MAG: T9SS type A sorting domain-containing protein, partial [Ignavibacterium sp.]
SITLDDTYNNNIIKFIPAQKIGFEDFTIQRDGGDGYSTDGGSSNFNFEYAINCWIYGVESWGTRGWHVGIGKSSNIYIHGNFFHHANDYGKGCGYGVTVFSRTSNCLIENNIFNFLRHSILTQASANRDVFGYNYSYDRNWKIGTADPIDGTDDISIHGTYSNSNLFEGNIIEYIYADYTTEHKDNGPFNTIFRNIVLDGYSLNDIDLESIDYVNLVGNKCDDVDFNSSNFKLDIYGINSNNNLYVSHNEYANNRSDLDPVVYCPDYSYYLTQKPSWMSFAFSWPPIGPRISTSSSYLSQSNPAYSRHLSGGKKTLNGNPLIVQPLSVTISGPSTAPCATGTWNANASGGYPPYSYQWYHMYTSSGGLESSLQKETGIIQPNRLIDTWYPVGNNTSTLNYYLCGGNSYLRVDVRDSYNTLKTVQYYVAGSNGGGGELEKEVAGNNSNDYRLESENPKEYNLEQNYPNPFNPSTIISYTIKKEGRVSIKIYDTLGKEVAALVDEIKPAGNYEVEFNGRELPSDVYIYKMQSAEYLSTSKMLLIK